MNEYKNIAIVDDHTMFRKGLVSLINLFHGYQVQMEAANGQDLIRQIQDGKVPHILLLDIIMNEMDGFTTARWISRNYPEIRILALSTMEGENAIIKMLRNGARGYVLKDAEPAELKRALDEVQSLGYFFNDLVSRETIRQIHSMGGSAEEEGIFSKLTDNELTFLKLACSEHTYFEIARTMCLSERTIDGYRDSIFRKLNVTTRVGMVLYAVKNGLIHV